MDTLLDTLDTQHPEEALAIVRSLLRLGADHWSHDYQAVQAVQGTKGTKWLDRSMDLLGSMHQGSYGSKVPKDYLSQAPNPRQFLEPMSWETISSLTHSALRTMSRMPDYSCGSIFYPDSLDRWLLSDNRGSKTSCFLRMLGSEHLAPEWTLADLAKAPSRERALIARVKDALPLADVDAVSLIYHELDNPIQEHTFWGRVGQVAAWLLEPETLDTRWQFGLQEARDASKRHGYRWGAVARLPGLIRRLVTYNGLGRGWFPVPGDREWRWFLEQVVMEEGIYLFRVESVESSGVGPSLSGCLTSGNGETRYLVDLDT